jgi:hypothetical protein
MHLYLDLLVAQLVIGRLLHLLRPRSPGCSFRSLGIALLLYRKQMLAQGEQLQQRHDRQLHTRACECACGRGGYCTCHWYCSLVWPTLPSNSLNRFSARINWLA